MCMPIGERSTDLNVNMGSSLKSDKKEKRDKGEKKSKKEKKERKERKERKEKRAVAQPEIVEPKAAKKAKVAGSGKHKGGLARMAEVGDRNLANTRKPIVKDLYAPADDIQAMSSAGVDAFREERRMAVENCDVKPLSSFQQTGLSKDELYSTRNFTTPSPIQSQCLPIAL